MPVPLPAHWSQQDLQIQFTPAGTLEQGGRISGSSQISRKSSKRGPVLTINLLPWALSATQAGHCHPVGDRMLPPILCTGNHSSHHADPLPGQSWVSGASALPRHPVVETPSSPTGCWTAWHRRCHVGKPRQLGHPCWRKWAAGAELATFPTTPGAMSPKGTNVVGAKGDLECTETSACPSASVPAPAHAASLAGSIP